MHVFSTGTHMPLTYILYKPVSRVPFVVHVRKLMEQCFIIPIDISLHTYSGTQTVYIDFAEVKFKHMKD